MRIVCDTNVIISGILFGGDPRVILRAVFRRRLEAFVSVAILNELRDVLSRRKFRMTTGRVDAAMELVRKTFTCVTIDEPVAGVAVDPDDDRVLEAALAAGAEVIISGDKHLLCLGAWRGIRIQTPAEFARTNSF
jgi:putative PIN family toxin of toxin-antitoxin system